MTPQKKRGSLPRFFLLTEENVNTCPSCQTLLTHEVLEHAELWSCPGCEWLKRDVLVSKCCGTSWSALKKARLPLITCDACGAFCEVRHEAHVMDPSVPNTFIDVTVTYAPSNNLPPSG